MSARSIINAAAGNADDKKLYVDDVFSTTLYVGNADAQTVKTGIQLGDTIIGPTVGQTTFVGPGDWSGARTYYWTCPIGVTSICVLCVGAGGNGAKNGPGLGGDAVYANNVPVKPGYTYCITAPSPDGGQGYDEYAGAVAIYGASFVGNGVYISAKSGNSGAGTQQSAQNGGGQNIGGTILTNFGGNGGYSGYCGGGANIYQIAFGSDGNGSTRDAPSTSYGAGGAGGYDGFSNGRGGPGVVRIIWGAGRAFPSTKTYDEATTASEVIPGNAGLVWIKDRGYANGHCLYDTVRGNTKRLSTNSSSGEVNSTAFGAFNADGFTVSNRGSISENGNTNPIVAWTFRKAPKFFDVVTWTGNGSTNRKIAHDLGVVPGIIFAKKLDESGRWAVSVVTSAQDTNANSFSAISLDSIDTRVSGYEYANSPSVHSDKQISVGNAQYLSNDIQQSQNQSGSRYVAYLFANDTSPDSMIRCGVIDAYVGAVINLGFEPQFLMFRKKDGSDQWNIIDTARGIPTGADAITLKPNVNAPEEGSTYVDVTPTGFVWRKSTGGVTTPYIYMAIRRPNKPPTSGADVFEPVTHTGTGSAVVRAVGSLRQPDLALNFRRSGGSGVSFFTRLLGDGVRLQSNSINTASRNPNWLSFSRGSSGVTVGTDTEENLNSPYVSYLLRRAAGVFDVVSYVGNGIARSIKHSLGASPELIIIKAKTNNTSAPTDWVVRAPCLGNNDTMFLNKADNAVNFADYMWNNSNPNKDLFQLSIDNYMTNSANGSEYVAYLFASRKGISKVGYYIGNGTQQLIDCEFTTGARFILIKQADTVNNWYIWDAARGINAATDPFLMTNSTASDNNSLDSVDPDPVGFSVIQNGGTNINVNGGKYLFLAFA